MREIDENYDDLEDLDDFGRFMNRSQSPNSINPEDQEQDSFEDAFMDDLPPSPARARNRVVQSIEPTDGDTQETSAGASSSNSFQVRQQSIKSESEDEDMPPTINPSRHASHHNYDATSVKDSQESSDTGITPPPVNLYDSTSPPPQSFSVQPPRGPAPSVEQIVDHRAAIQIAHSEDDDDIMFIDSSNASIEAQRKWQQYTPNTKKDDVVFIKSEPKEKGKEVQDPVTTSPKKPRSLPDIIANQDAQRAIYLAEQAARNSPSWSSQHDPQEEGSGTNSRGRGSFRYQSPDIPGIIRESREDPMQVDAAMRPGDEDDSWMEQDDDVDDEYESMKANILRLQKKSTSANFSTEEKMFLFKLQKQFAVKERLRVAASRRSDDEDDSLFVPENRVPEKRSDIIRRHRHNLPRPVSSGDDVDEDDNFGGGSQVSDDGDGDAAFGRMLEETLQNGSPDRPDLSTAPLGLTKAGKPRKRRAKNAREFVAQEEEARREKERGKTIKKRGRPVNPATKQPKATKTAKGKAKKGSKAKKPTKGRGKKGNVKDGESLLKPSFKSFSGQDVVGQMILDDLINNDPISDRLLDPVFDRGPEPKITGKLAKETQFQQLFASIPDTGDSTSKKAAKDDKKKLKEASRSFGYAQCKAQDGKWLIKGMKSTLYHHQLLGAQWMVQRELSSTPPNGGLLADSMGLGKTVQMLACMVGNPPSKQDLQRGTKATLIVVPAGVIDQWLDEIRHHTHDHIFPKILQYKQSAKIPKNILEDVDIVVTSYNEVMKQFPYPDAKARVLIQQMGYQNWWSMAIKEMGDLHNIPWYRVVLDEAQAIKNNSARTSLACQNLKSVYRWCLTGTPLLNRLEELFPYLRFLKANYTMDWTTFQKYFCDVNTEDSYSRISTLLSYTMMRRTMKTTILNRPIITLPTPHPEVVHVNFSPEEQIIYRITENRFRTNLNTFFAKGNIRRNYGIFMVQLLRLRQCTGHPFMLERTIKESWTLEDVTELQDKLAKLRSTENRKPFYEQCKVWVEQSEQQRAAATAAGEEFETLPFGNGDYGNSFDFAPALGQLSEKDLFARVVCSICADVPMGAVKTDCGHIFCEECLSTYMQGRVNSGDDYLTCPSCDRVFIETERVQRGQVPNISDDVDFDRHSVSSKKSSGKHGNNVSSKGRDALGFEPHTNDSTWITKSDHDPDFPLTPSSKTTALKSILLRGFVDAPFDKVVIYCQFRSLARIIGRICHGEGWGFLYLTGDSSLDHRTKTIRKFREDNRIKILIAGLKCGGLGLNFPWANRCISLDLWWNHAVEQQAFGRIFRIGQEKETYMTRLVVRNSVDMRMMSMQLHKLQNLERAMRDGEYNREQPNLSLKQLANLFGFLKTDDDDNIISVEADYTDELVEEGEGSAGCRGEVDLTMEEM